ncbi:enoyl-CoA hydratase-related protein [Hyphomonas sp.]|uniref:enoyl-CoA hydratase/isomerase family protein n=1 Tax=Hyphomonas sp. TaxID=87 RepID=UPI0032ED00B2
MALIYEKRGGIAYLTLNRPDVHNALDAETLVEMADAWVDYRDDPDLRCAIFTGAGDKTFCSGADLGKLTPIFTGARQPETKSEKQIVSDPTLIHRAGALDIGLFKPVIAAVNGRAIAGGMELLFIADIRVASEHATFGLPEVKRGVLPSGGSTAFLPRLIPRAAAVEMMMTGEPITAADALRLGFANHVTPKGEEVSKAEEIAAKICKNGPLAVAGVKESVARSMAVSPEEALKIESEVADRLFLTEDAREGPRAFKEKREPVFKGR